MNVPSRAIVRGSPHIGPSYRTSDVPNDTGWLAITTRRRQPRVRSPNRSEVTSWPSEDHVTRSPEATGIARPSGVRERRIPATWWRPSLEVTPTQPGLTLEASTSSLGLSTCGPGATRPDRRSHVHNTHPCGSRAV